MLTASRAVLDHLKLGSSELFLAMVAGRVFHRRGGPKRTRDCLGLSSTGIWLREHEVSCAQDLKRTVCSFGARSPFPREYPHPSSSAAHWPSLTREITDRRDAMLKCPLHGFAKRVEDTAMRAMIILRVREDFTTTRDAPPLAPGEQRPSLSKSGRNRVGRIGQVIG